MDAHRRGHGHARQITPQVRRYAAPRSKFRLPIEVDGARILALRGREVFTAYVRTPKGPVFMRLIEKTLGQELTTRTWETVAKVARA